MRNADLTAAQPPRNNVLKWAAFATATLLTAFAEFELSVLMGTPKELAWAFPAMLMCFGIWAFQGHRPTSVLTAVLLMMGSQIAAHLLSPHVPNGIPVIAVIVVSCIPPVILWRIHAGDHHTAATEDHTLTTELAEVRAEAAALRAAAIAEREHTAAQIAALTAQLAEVQAEADTLRATPAKVQLSKAAIIAEAQQARAKDPKVTVAAIARKLDLSRQRVSRVLNAAGLADQFATA